MLAGCAECTNSGNQVVQMTWPGSAAGGEERFGYDARGNAVYSEKIIAGKSFVTRRKFDVAMRQIGIVHPDGTAFDDTLDGAGRTIAVSGAVTSAEYNERGQPARVVFANGSTTTYGYDGRVRMTSIKTSSKGAELLAFSYTLSSAGDVTAVGDGALKGRLHRAQQYTLDGWDRLTKVVLPSGTGAETLDYTFDAIDNLTRSVSSAGASSRAHVGQLTYDATKVNAAVSAGTLGLTYDAAGGMISRAGTPLTRDHRGRLVGASGPEGSGRGRSTFTYNDLERVAKQEGDSTVWYIDRGFEVRDGIAQIYAELNGQRIMRSQTDRLASKLLSDLSMDSKIDIADAWLAQGAKVGVVPLTTLPAGVTPSDAGQLLRSAARRLLMEDAIWLHRDNLNSAVVATDATGEIRAERSYYPTGAIREEVGYVDEKGFTDQELDESTGLVHFRFRELDPYSGRWDRPDPSFQLLDAEQLKMTGEFNSGYAYVANSFNDAYDPNGLRLDRMKGPRKAFTGYLKGKLSKLGTRVGEKASATATAAGEKLSAAGDAIATRWAKAKDNRERKEMGVRKAEFNREISTTEKVATAVGGVVAAASIAATVANMISNMLGKTDEEHGKPDGLQTTTTILSVSNGLLSLGIKTPAMKSAYRSVPVAPGRTVRAISSSRSRAPTL